VKEGVGRHRAPTPRALEQDLAVEREHHRRHLGGRIGVRHRPAHGAAVADRRMTDVAERLCEQRRPGLSLGARHADAGADLDRSAFVPDRVQLLDTHDVDQHAGRGDPQVHHRDQALPAGQHGRLVAVLGKRADRLLACLGREVFAGARLHNRSASTASVPTHACSAAAAS
jgi:hypothetical protein